jgi:hypothetical protein
MAKTLDDLGPVQIPSNSVTVEIGRDTTAASATATLAATVAATSTAPVTSTATATPSPVSASTVALTATPAPFCFEATTYRDERAGFEFNHPRSWNICLQEEQSRGYVVNLCASSPDQPNLSITVARWEPHNLKGYAAQREHAWTSSGSTIVHRMEWMLEGDHLALRYLIEGRDGELVFVLITAVGERYLVLAGDGDRDMLAAIVGRLRFFEPIAERVPEPEMTASPNNDRTLARQALETYFALLHAGRYSEAVAYYGGDYQVLRDRNPDVASDDYAKLLERACRPHGTQCMALKEIVVQVERSPAEYHFLVQFADHDGSTYVRLPCCGGSSEPSRDQFAYTVLKVKDRFLVQELPVYIP